MFDWLFKQKSKTQLGVDLGSSSIKIVELGRKEERPYLVNYGLAQLKGDATINIIDLEDEEIVKLLTAVISEAKFSGRRANISYPVDKTFSTTISLPAMPANELAAAVSFEAHKYVPIPLEEVELDWLVVANDNGGASANLQNASDSIRGGAQTASGGVSAAGQPIQVLLMAVPKEIIRRINNIVNQAGLKVAALEQEAFSLARSLIGNDKNTFVVIDLGRRGADIIILDQGFIKLSHALDSINKEIVLMEIDRIVNIFQMRYNKKIGQCLLTGGRANEKDLFDFLSAKLKMPVKVGDAFARVVHEPQVAGFLKELNPQLSVAVGLAMRDN